VRITLNPHQAVICHFLSSDGSLIIHELTTWKMLHLSLQPQSWQFTSTYIAFGFNERQSFGEKDSVYITVLCAVMQV
jgi:hypothetical protein